MSKTTIFDLEQQILNCWNVTSDLSLLLENVIENDTFNRDNISNVVLGMEELYQLKFDKCFRTFEQVSAEFRAQQRELEWLQQQFQAKELFAVAKEERIAELEAKLAELKPKVRKKVKKNA